MKKMKYFICKKNITIIALMMLIGLSISAQQNSFVYMRDGNFYKGCDDFYMMGVNYRINRIETLDSITHISPYVHYCLPVGCGPDVWKSCGKTDSIWRTELGDHLTKISSLGFNTIRLLGLGVDVLLDSVAGNALVTSEYLIQNPPDSNCYTYEKGSLLGPEIYQKQGDLLEQMIEALQILNLDIKLIISMGGGGVEMFPDEYAAYLDYMSDRFKDEPAIIGYDLYNEPEFSAKVKLTKSEASHMCLNWYNTIKQNAPSHLVTIGSKFYDLFRWDPEILPLDFISFHPYALRKESENWAYQPPVDRYKVRLQYMYKNFSIPYLIGESGCSGTDKFRESCNLDSIHPSVGDTTMQINFANESLKYTKWYGHKGYTWWKYKDTGWRTCKPEKAFQNYFGIVYMEDIIGGPEEHKPVGQEFIDFDPNAAITGCVDPDPITYANPTETSQIYDLFSGSFRDSTNNYAPIDDVFIWTTVTNITIDEVENSFAITNNQGAFTIKTSFSLNDSLELDVKCSKPGWQYYHIWYPGGQNPIDTVDYYLALLNPDTIAQKPEYQSWTITAGMDTTWYQPQVPAHNDVIVEDGATLTIKTSVYFNSGSRLIVERGGTLIVEANGKLTSNCSDDLWAGVEVWGNASLKQTSEEQGRVELINGGTIENAEFGIRAIKTLSDQGEGELVNFNYTGGIVIAKEAIFKNNKTAVKFYDYEFISHSFFTDCDFIIDNEYIGTNDPDYFVKLYNMNRVDFTFCRFKNNSSIQCYGGGIYSLNSAFKVEGECLGTSSPCTDWAYGEFENLKYAIYATSGGTVYFPEISHTDFTDNYRGVYLSAIEKASVKYCTISTGPMCAGASYGLYLDASTGYTIEENYFDMGYTDGIGIVVNNSGPAPNIIYNNQFNDLKFGIIAQKENRAKDGTGLVFKCNQYNDVKYDEQVFWEGQFISNRAGIASSQGYFDQAGPQPEHMAGNLFQINTDPVGDNDDMYNEANDFIYYYPENVHPDYGNVEPKDFTDQTITANDVYIPGGIDWTLENGCPSSEEPGGGGSGKDGLRDDLKTADGIITSTEATLAVLVDGGDTEALSSEVETSVPPETMQVYNELMDKSPYLSDTVVSAAIEKENVLPNAMVRDIMVANPHTARSNELMTKLDERWDPLPQYMKAQILQGKSIVSIKEQLESELAAYKQQEAKAFNGLVHWFMTDTLTPAASSDSLLLLFQQDNTLSSKYSLTMLHLERAELQTGLDVMNGMPNQFGLQGDDLVNHQEMVSYCNLKVDLMNEDKTMMEADSIQLDQLLGLGATENGLASVYARNILLALEKIEYDEPILFPDQLKSAQAFEEYQELLNTQPPKQLEIYPNPSDNYVIISYKLELEKSGYAIRISDLKGNTMKISEIHNRQDQIVIATQNWKPGVYILTLEMNGNPVESVKFTIL